jgi:glycosyltransferase involved in cell wall biosynthesis
MSVYDLSVVVPLYNEHESLPELNAWICRVADAAGYSFEIIYVNDGSTDASLEVLEGLAATRSEVKVVSFQKNYGKSAALQVGFEHTQGKVVITLDADLQDSPDEIPALYDMIVNQGYDMVSGWKKLRHDPISKTVPSKLFNWVTQQVSGIKLHDFNCGLKAYRGRVVHSIVVYGEMHRYIPLIAKWSGFTKIGEKVVEHRARKYGVTKFGLDRFVFGFLDLLSIVFVSKFKKRPMHFFGSIGTFLFLVGLAITGWLVSEKFYASMQGHKVREVTAQPLFFLALTALVIGFQMFLAGFIGEMISQTTIKKNDYQIERKINLTAERLA